jgi:hypothetical protein
MPRTICRCCQRRKSVNAIGLCDDCAICLHCEKQPAVTDLGLCQRCHDRECIRNLYERRDHWTPAWEMHLRRLTRHIQRELKKRRRLRTLEIDSSAG